MERVELLAGGRHPLTYCTNVHPASSLDEAEQVLREQAAPTLRHALGEGTLCVGAWWPHDVAATLAAEPERLGRHVDLCRELGIAPLSLNVFPFGRFHGVRVKEAVYGPEWDEEPRLAYTLAAARAAALLLARLGQDTCVLSTVPLGFRGEARDRRPRPEHARNLFHLAVALERLADETGVHVVVALEPEPWCLLETVAETVTWLADDAMGYAAAAGNEAAARRHLGLCLDLCHAAVVGESPESALELCVRSGVRVGKVQLSSAILARGPAGRDALLEYDEPVYLHQTFATSGAGPFLDLSDPALRTLTLRDEDILRSHFHVPLHWAGDGALGTSRAQVEAFLELVDDARLPAGTPLEVETYTNPRIAEEVEFVVASLTGSPERG